MSGLKEKRGTQLMKRQEGKAIEIFIQSEGLTAKRLAISAKNVGPPTGSFKNK